MAILTNKFNLPEPLVKAVERPSYQRDPKRYSVTELIDSPRIVHLRRRHEDEIEEDATERIWALLGQVVHGILERGHVPDALKEEKIVLEINDRKIVGKPDLYHEGGKISDYKLTSVWSAMDGVKKEWAAQLNVYAELYESIGFPVHELEIVTIYRDWSKNKAKTEEGYPRAQVEVFKVELWPPEVRRAYIEQHVKLLKFNEALADDQLVDCTDEEMWAQPTKYAVMKNGNKRALRVLDTEAEAQTYMEGAQKTDPKAKLYIQVRPGVRTRCEDYCPVARWCTQYQAYKASQAATGGESQDE